MEIDDVVVCISSNGLYTITEGNHYIILDKKSSEKYISSIYLVKSDQGRNFWVAGTSFTTTEKYREYIINKILK